MINVFRSTVRTIGVVSLSLACAMPALAQSTTGSSGTGMSAGNGSTTSTTAREEHRDYGWIGLLGLVGLLGLRRKPEDRVDANRTTSTSR
jgi:hypothetical protein